MPSKLLPQHLTAALSRRAQVWEMPAVMAVAAALSAEVPAPLRPLCRQAGKALTAGGWPLRCQGLQRSLRLSRGPGKARVLRGALAHHALDR